MSQLSRSAPADQDELLYQRWVKQRRELVDKLSNGTVGYVHVRGMNDESYRETYSEALGRDSKKKALIVDTRFNGGGNLHDVLATFLSGKPYLEFFPRGQSIGWEPNEKWYRKSVVLAGESNYSDAHLFPWVYQHFGIGKLVGMPVPGTGTAVWWELLQDPRLILWHSRSGFPGRKRSVHGKDAGGTGRQSAERREEHGRRQRPASRKSG